MDRMTVGLIERWRQQLTALSLKHSPNWEELNQLCDLALQALSLESVRSEALEEAAKVCDGIAFSRECADDTMQGVRDAHPYKQCAAAIRALKSSPESPAQEQPVEQNGECCCAIHHPNYGRCLQCPIHGTPPPPERP